MLVLVVIEAVAIALLALLVAGLLRSHAEILRSLHDLGVDPADPGRHVSPAHSHSHVHDDELRVAPGVPRPRTTDSVAAADLSGASPTGDALVVGVAGAKHDTLLAFLSSGCLTCGGFWEAFADPIEIPGDARLVVLTKDASEESPSRIAELAPPGVTVMMSSAAWGDYEVPVAPYFVYVDGPSGQIVGEGAATRWPQVVSLLSQARADAGFTSRGRPRRGAGADREIRVDRDLLAAGIRPGDPRLYDLDIDDGPPAAD